MNDDPVPRDQPIVPGLVTGRYDYPRLVFVAPYFEQVPLAELFWPAIREGAENVLPDIIGPIVDDAAAAAVQSLAVQRVGDTMSGPLFFSNPIPTQDSQAASKLYVDMMVATGGVPEVPILPANQVWARELGAWVPLGAGGNDFLPLSGGTMTGPINMGGSPVNNLPALPVAPNGAAPMTWVLNQIAAQSLYQGVWHADTNTPDLTSSATHQNDFSWIAVTDDPAAGVTVTQPIPGLQGLEVFNGDNIIYSAISTGQFQIVRGGGLSLAEANALFLPVAGGSMLGPLLLSEAPVADLEAASRAWVLEQVVADAPSTGIIYGRSNAAWVPIGDDPAFALYLPLLGGALSGPLTLAGNATSALQPVTLQQLTAELGVYLPTSGGTLTGYLTLSGNAAAALQAVPLQQLTSAVAAAPFLPLAGGNVTGNLGVHSAPAANAIPGSLFVGAGITLPGGIASNLNFNVYQPTPSTFETIAGGVISASIGTSATTLALSVAPPAAAGAAPAWAGGMVIDASGNMVATNALYIGVVAASFGLWSSAGQNNLAYGPGWFWSFQESTGNLQWNVAGTGTPGLIYRSSDWLFYNVLGGMGGYGPYQDLSDRRSKANVEPATHGLDVILQLEPVSFQRLPSGDTAAARRHRTELGFIAQDVKSVLPEAVVDLGIELPGGAGKLDSASPSLGLTSSVITAVLCNAVKELHARLAAMEHGGEHG